MTTVTGTPAPIPFPGAAAPAVPPAATVKARVFHVIMEGTHFEFDRALGKEQAAQVIFQRGVVPEHAELVKGSGNTWILEVHGDIGVQQDLVRHYNSHVETVDTSKYGEAVFTWRHPAMPAAPAPVGPARRDLRNDLGFRIAKNDPLDDGQSPVRHVKSFVGKGHGYEFVFEMPMTARQVKETLFVKGRYADADVQLVPAGQEPSTTWQVRVIGVDAATAWKTPVFRAVGDAVVYGPATLPPGLPAGVRAHLENRTVPAHAKQHPGNVHVWEQDGTLVHVTKGNGSYLPEVTRLSSDEVSNNAIRWFLLEKGLPPREAWQAFVEHWDEIHREIITAYALALAAAGGMPGRAPGGGAGEGAQAITRGRS